MCYTGGVKGKRYKKGQKAMINTGKLGTHQAFEMIHRDVIFRGEGKIIREAICGVYVEISTCSMPILNGTIIYIKRSDLFDPDAFFCVECGYRCVCQRDGWLESLDN